MNFKQLLQSLDTLSEAVKDTGKGVIHTADAGGYGRKDDEGDDGKKVAGPEVKRGRGRPKKGADASGEVKQYANAKGLQDFIVGNQPKKLPGKATVKHTLKDWIEHIDSMILEGETKEKDGGLVHKGTYGNAYDVSDKEKDAPAPAVKRGRGRPKKGADASGEVKQYANAKGLQDFIVGNQPKKLPGKATVKHKIKEAEQIQIKPASQLPKLPGQTSVAGQQTAGQPAKNTQVIQQGNKTLGTVDNPQLAQQIKQSIGKGEMTLADEEGLAEASPESSAKGLKSWQVVIMNNYYNGKYANYSGRYYPVLASSPEEAKKVVLDNAEAILQELLARNGHNGKKILPRRTARPITANSIGAVEDGTIIGRMGTFGFKKMYSPRGIMHVKLADGAIVDVQGQTTLPDEEGVEESIRRNSKPKFIKYTNFEQWDDELHMRGAVYTETRVDEGHLVGVAVVRAENPEERGPRNNNIVGLWYNQAKVGSFVQEGSTFKFDSADHYAELDTTWPYEESGMDESLAEGSTGDYSAKKAHAGKDIGKPGKNFEKIAKKAGDTYGSKKAGERVAGAVLSKLRKAESVNESYDSDSRAAFHRGKAHALANESYNCTYDDPTQAEQYLAGYKAGLDECYGDNAHSAVPETTSGFTDSATFGPTEISPEDFQMFESWDRDLSSLLNEYNEINEGLTVSSSSGQQGSPDSVTISATDGDADELLSIVRQAGLGMFGDGQKATAGFSANIDQPEVDNGAPAADIEVVDDQDGMLDMIRQLAGTSAPASDSSDSEDFADEEPGHEHDACTDCGQEDCVCVDTSDSDNSDDVDGNDDADSSTEVIIDDDESEDSDEEVDESYSNDTEDTFEADINYMTRVISGGLNKEKSTGQTTVPVVAGQGARVNESNDSVADWKKLAGI